MPLYRIPLMERCTELNDAHFGRQKLMCVDGVGFYVKYRQDQEDQLTPENMRRYLMGRSRTWCFLRAVSPKHAIKKFHAEWEGAKCGEGKPERHALWIDTSDECIEEYPRCDHLILDKHSMPRCGHWGECCRPADCILDGSDGPEECPIREYQDIVWEMRQHLPVVTVEGGYRVLRAQDIAKLPKSTAQEAN